MPGSSSVGASRVASAPSRLTVVGSRPSGHVTASGSTTSSRRMPLPSTGACSCRKSRWSSTHAVSPSISTTLPSARPTWTRNSRLGTGGVSGEHWRSGNQSRHPRTTAIASLPVTTPRGWRARGPSVSTSQNRTQVASCEAISASGASASATHAGSLRSATSGGAVSSARGSSTPPTASATTAAPAVSRRRLR